MEGRSSLWSGIPLDRKETIRGDSLVQLVRFDAYLIGTRLPRLF